MPAGRRGLLSVASKPSFYRILYTSTMPSIIGDEPGLVLRKCRPGMWPMRPTGSGAGMSLTSPAGGVGSSSICLPSSTCTVASSLPWGVHPCGNGELAADLIERARWREHLTGQPLILHTDNGALQRSLTLWVKLQSLDIEPSYSRPGVSDENTFIESWFHTLKYVPSYPSRGFADVEQARQWCTVS